jgi:hypothetical protein
VATDRVTAGGLVVKKAKREALALLLGLTGGTGSGKTYSALLLAQGLAGEKRVALLDTENGRALHYADMFDFDHVQIGAPFRARKYHDAIRDLAAMGYGAIIVDSFSHEWQGEGGVIDFQEEEVQRLSQGDVTRRDAYNLVAWKNAKHDHNQLRWFLPMVGSTHLVVCFRAEPKVGVTKENGRTVVKPKEGALSFEVGSERYHCITDTRLLFEMTMLLAFVHERPGVPIPIKLEEQHRFLFPDGQAVSVAAGAGLAHWASGKPINWIAVIQASTSYAQLKLIGKQIEAVAHMMSPPQLAVTREEFKHHVERLQAQHKARLEAAAQEAANP